MDRIFKARSVCFVGVSADPEKTSGTPLRILMRHRFAGEVLLVNPKYDAIEGIPCYPSLADLPGSVDVAFISLAARLVPDAVAACGRKGIKAAVILYSGFEEVAGGEAVAERLKAAAAEHGIAIVGPNSEGIWSVHARVILTFGSAARRDSLIHGPIAALTQSGGVGGAIVRQLQDGGYGCGYFVSVGNEANLGIADYVDYLAGEDDVAAIVMFIEGVADGRRLIEAAARARAAGIRLIALKSGDSARGREATASHTGKISTDREVYRDMFDQAGILCVASLVELIDAGKVLTSLPAPPRRGANGGLCILSVLGGPRSIMADACERLGVPLAAYAPATLERLEAIVPAFGYAPNPTDLTGQIVGNPEMLKLSLDAVAGDPNVEAVLIQFGNGGIRDVSEKRELFVGLARRTGLPVILSLLGDNLDDTLKLAYAKDGIFVTRDASEAITCFGWLYRSREFLGRSAALAVETAGPERKRALPTDWPGMAELLTAAGIATPRWALLAPSSDAADACRDLAFPLALKALPGDADHKTERGLVALGLGNPAALGRAAAAIRGRLGAPDATLLAQEMVEGGTEVVISVRRDADFGPILAVGAGGVLIELLRDVGYVSLPAGADEVERRIASLKLGALLGGFRGAPPGDVAALARAAIGLGRVFAEIEGVSEIEINPLIVLPAGEGVKALDILVK